MGIADNGTSRRTTLGRLHFFISRVCFYLFVLQLEKFRNHNSQWLSMVDSQENADDIQTYGPIEDDEADLPTYLTSEYLDQLYLLGGDGADENDCNKHRSGSSMSNYSRPVSR